MTKREIENNEMNARQIAVRILTRVEKEGAYANILLRSQLAGIEDSRERNLTTALVNGVLKNKMTLDFALRKHLSKPMSALPNEVRAALRIGVFQILFLDKIPHPVAINESVEALKAINPTFVPLVNSVLRKSAEKGWNFSWPNKQKEPVKYLATYYSHPEWLVKKWLKRWGYEETEALLKVNNSPSNTCVRTNTLKISQEQLKEDLEKEGIKVTRGKVPETLYLDDFGAIESLPAFKQGQMTVQDESSQLVAHILQPQPGDRVLDVCSSPGGKTTHIAQMMQNSGQILAVDLYPQKLEKITELAKRLGITCIDTMEGDARLLEGVEGTFDRVLVDAPCSGLGVIRRRADLRWQKNEEEIKALPKLQLEILLKASEYVREEGELVYSTCTTEPEENFEVVKAFRKLRPQFQPVDLSEALPFAITDERDLAQLKKGVWQILPHKDHMDGFFLAKFKRMTRKESN